MGAKVRLRVTKGETQGKSYEYDEITRVLIGRQGDCDIIMPERTVSRYHCLLEINPPNVRLQDFGSLNGTFLNGKMIGQREKGTSWEEAKDQHHDAFDLKDGDVLALGTQCEVTCEIQRESCPLCGAPLEDQPPQDNEATVLISDRMPVLRLDAQGRRICQACWEKQQKAQEEKEKRDQEKREREKLEREKRRKEKQERLEKEKAEAAEKERAAAEEKAKREAEAAEGRKKCAGCGRLFTPIAADNNLCSACLADRGKVLDGVLAMLNINAQKLPKQEKAVGAAILSGYDKVSLLGKGGMGEVWKVRERSTGREYALKTMLPDVALDEHSKQLFLREAGICECLRHPNVVKAYKTGSVNGVLFILMDLCGGGSADDLIKKKGGRLSVEMATWIILQVLSGLDYCHNMDIDVEIKAGRYQGMKEVSVKGIVHRDFKPGNIFLSDTGDHPVAMVADFGMAKAFSVAGKSQVSQTGTVMGTPVFMPKQQVRNCKYAKPEVDVWAAAASYYYMLTGQFAKNFRPGVNVWQVMLTESAVPIRQRNPRIPERLAAVIDRALVEDPHLPYSSAAKLRADIVAALPENVKTYCKDIL